jgi:hypothetical protein
VSYKGDAGFLVWTLDLSSSLTTAAHSTSQKVFKYVALELLQGLELLELISLLLDLA